MSMSIISAYLFHQKLCVVSCLCSFNVKPVCISIHASPFPSLSLSASVFQHPSAVARREHTITRSHDWETRTFKVSHVANWCPSAISQHYDSTQFDHRSCHDHSAHSALHIFAKKWPSCSPCIKNKLRKQKYLLFETVLRSTWPSSHRHPSRRPNLKTGLKHGGTWPLEWSTRWQPNDQPGSINNIFVGCKLDT